MKKKTVKNSTQKFDDFLVNHLRNNPREIPLFLQEAFDQSKEDQNWAAFMISLRAAVEAKGGVTELAEQMGCSRTSLYKTLSQNGNPKLETTEKIMNYLGLKLTISNG